MAADSAGLDSTAVPVVTAPTLDTLRGVVGRVGSEPATRLVLTGSDGRVLASLSGGSEAELGAVTGAEVVVAGGLSGARDPMAAPVGAPVFEVAWFEVRAVDGREAQDGVLELAGGSWYLRSRTGMRRPVAMLPQALRAQAGARVFLVGPLDREPSGYGVIRPAP